MRYKPIKDLTWETAPDVIDPIILARILGIGQQKARNYFKSKTFPCMDDELIADKEAVHLWWQGLYRKNEKDSTIGMLLIEQRKTNNLLEKMFNKSFGGVENE